MNMPFENIKVGTTENGNTVILRKRLDNDLTYRGSYYIVSNTYPVSKPIKNYNEALIAFAEQFS